MNIRFSLSDFLYDKKYFIAMYEDKIYIYHYKDISSITDKQIIVNIDNFKLIVNGIKLSIKKMDKDEILIIGQTISIGKDYE